MHSAVDDSKKNRVTCWTQLHDEPDADWQCDVVEQKVFRDFVVALSQEEDKNLREEREVVQKIPPSERNCFITMRGFVKRLTSGKTTFDTSFTLCSFY